MAILARMLQLSSMWMSSAMLIPKHIEYTIAGLIEDCMHCKICFKTNKFGKCRENRTCEPLHGIWKQLLPGSKSSIVIEGMLSIDKVVCVHLFFSYMAEDVAFHRGLTTCSDIRPNACHVL